MNAAVRKSGPATIAVLDERLNGHVERDDERFGALDKRLERVEGKVDAVAEDVSAIKGKLETWPATLEPDGDAPGPWHIGARAWGMIVGILGVLGTVIGFLFVHAYPPAH